MEDTTSSALNSFFIPRLLRSSSIDSVLNRPNIKLDDLLDEEDFLYDLKNGNPKLLDYFSKNTDNILKLIDFIIVLPPDPSDQKRAHKFPFVACEIFESDIAPIMNAFFFTHALKVSENNSPNSTGRGRDSEDYEVILSQDSRAAETANAEAPNRPKSLLEYLFTFIETDQELNPILAGYFNKVVQVLFRRNPRRMVEFVYETENLLPMLTKHIQDKSISELVSIFINYEAMHTDEKFGSRLNKKIKILDQIIDTLIKPTNEQNETEENINAASIINDIVQKHGNIVDGKEIIQHIESSKVFQKLFDALKGTNTSKITCICNVLIALLLFYFPDSSNLGPYEPSGPGKSQSSSEKDTVLSLIASNMETFKNILEQKSDDESENNFNTVFGGKVRGIGTWRLKAIEFIQKAIMLEDQDIYEKIDETNILKIISDWFNESPWNNILHSIFERLVLTIFDKSDPTLTKSLFEKAKLLDIIIQAWQQPEIELPKRGRKVRKGYMGHIIRISNQLVRFGNIEDSIERQLKSNSQWSQFVNSYLKKQNEINNTEIGGYNPRSFAMPSMESSFGSLALAESQSQSFASESFAAMPAEVEVVVEEEQPTSKHSPSKAGDIAESLAAQERKESLKNSMVEDIINKFNIEQEINEFTKSLEIMKKPLLEPAVIRKEDNELVDSILGNGNQEYPQESEKNSSPIKEKVSYNNSTLSPTKVPTETVIDTKERNEEQKAQLDSITKEFTVRTEINNENTSPNRIDNIIRGSFDNQETKPAGPIPENLRQKNPAMEEMRKSILGPKGAKMKLKVKKGEKGNASKIFEAIEKFKLQNSLSSSNLDFTVSEMSDSRMSEGLSVLEDEYKEEMLARSKEEKNKDKPDSKILDELKIESANAIQASSDK